MFESIRLPHDLRKEDFQPLEERLRESLLDAQFELAEQKRKCVLALINGSDGAGKGEVLNKLYDWLDDHYVETLSYDQPTEEESLRPVAWRYWRDMPAKGRIGLVLGSWYHRVLRERATGRMSEETFRNTLEEINRVGKMLFHEGVLVLKIWLFMDESKARKRLANIREPDGSLRRAVGTRMGRNRHEERAQSPERRSARIGRGHVDGLRALGGRAG